ncbi:MAG: bifunctional folylpolyglutamate synthase/dihydrofolate synthase [Bacteroidales bacterium]|nr:bifunctional folylpolyglutamate synthase/dihydrofolate synthase [Bacteroidales bacterium]
MNYQQTLDFLFSQLPMFQRIGKAAYKANLDNTNALDEYFNHPHKLFKTIHIAGTNGKGSVSHMLAAVLQKAGYKTGLYTSPHLKDFRERIKINGKEITESKVVEFVEKHKEAFTPIKPSFFELTVAMAFDYFANEKVDVAVIETGLGGKLDSTNIIQPEISVITNISMDHMQFLGDTLDKIATEKAGIIKAGVPVVIGEYQQDIAIVFERKAKEIGADLRFADKNFSIGYSMQTTDEKQIFQVYQNDTLAYPDLKTDLLGLYQQKNTITVLQAVELLIDKGFSINKENIYGGLENASKLTGLRGRWHTIGRNPRIVCDTGHNEAGMKLVLEQIKSTPYKNLHMVFGVVDDKNIDTILAMLPQEATYYFCRASIPRALDEKMLMEKALVFGLKGQTFTSVSNALDYARQIAVKEDFIFIGGSTFVVADIL